MDCVRGVRLFRFCLSFIFVVFLAALPQDLAARVLYWTDNDTDRIYRAEPDGSNRQILMDASDGVVPEPSTGMLLLLASVLMLTLSGRSSSIANTHRMRHIGLYPVTLLSICGATVASADTIAIEPEPTDLRPYRFSRAATFGWGFTVETVAISVTQLGVFDAEGDGLAEPHEVGIWNFGGGEELLASAVIPAGTEATLAGGFRYVSIEPTTLPGGPGTGIYSIGAFYREGSDDLFWSVDDADEPPAIFYRIDLSSSDPQFQFPGETGRGEDPGHFGPNFQFNVVPEPATGGCLIVGFLLAITFWRCRSSAPRHRRAV